jgi:hypothetical protein
MLIETKRLLPNGNIIIFTFNPDNIIWYQPKMDVKDGEEIRTILMPINGPELLICEPYVEFMNRLKVLCR